MGEGAVVHTPREPAGRAGVHVRMWVAWVLGCSSSVAAPPSLCEGLVEADGFDFPVGAPDARGYYDAQPFGQNTHLGSDWNGLGGGDSDFGDPVFAVAAGRVVSSDLAGPGWGRVVRVVHTTHGACVESLYAHVSRVDVVVGQLVSRGARVGAIGDADGVYKAHLHFELRTAPERPLGGGYGEPDGQVDAAAFIRAHRP